MFMTESINDLNIKIIMHNQEHLLSVDLSIEMMQFTSHSRKACYRQISTFLKKAF